MEQPLDQTDGPSIPTFNLYDTDYSLLPRPNDTGAFRLVVPTHGLDTQFIWKLSQLLGISFELNDFIEQNVLHFVVTESFRQMFTDFDRSPAVYLQMLQGSLSDHNIPGLPTQMYFGHVEQLKQPAIWAEFRTLFRWYAQELYNCVLAWANTPQYSGLIFTYNDYPAAGNSLGFIISSPRRMQYEI